MMHRGRCYVSYTWHTTESYRNHDQETSGVEHMLETLLQIVGYHLRKLRLPIIKHLIRRSNIEIQT